jgi:serine/threonine-protein kinase
MIACPTSEALLDLLRGALPTDSASMVRLHVEACASCLEALDRLSDDRELAVWIEAGLGAGGGPALRDALGSLAPAPAGASTIDDGRPRTIGAYEIEAEVGRGGMGVVYRARDRTLGRVVALKVLRPDLDDDRARRRFVREVRAAAAVEHDHVVRVYATSEPSEPVLSFAMEFVDGPSLADRIAAEGRLAPREAAELVAQAAEGLAAAHAAGLVHRDVKPDNILIDAAAGRAKIGDFGLARLAVEASDLTRSGVVAGTPAYLSPEQARGDAGAGFPADVYGLGATLYECLTGEVPFRGTPHMVVQQILHDDPRPPRRLNDAIPRDLETICLKALAREPHRRYATAAAMAEDLRRWGRGEPIRARAVGRIERGWRLARRRPLSASLVAALAIALVAGSTASLLLWRRAEAHLRDAERDYRRARDAVDRFYVKLYTNGILNQPGTESARTEVVRDAIAYYRAFLLDHGDDPALRADVARASFAAGKLLYDTGDRREARDLLEQAVPLLEEIARANPAELNVRREIAQCHDLIAQLENALGRTAEAIAAHSRSADAYRALAAAEPANPRWARMVGHALGNLGNTQAVANHREESRAAYKQARDQFEALLRADAGNADYRRDLSITLGNLAAVVDLADRGPLLREALAIQEALAAARPDDSYARRNVAVTRTYLAEYLSASGRFAEALPLAEAACETLRQVVRQEPGRIHYTGDLADALNERARALLELGRAEEALAILDEATTLHDRHARVDPENSMLWAFRTDTLGLVARVHDALGRPGEALRARQARIPLLDRLARERPDDPEHRTDLEKERRAIAAPDSRTSPATDPPRSTDRPPVAGKKAT